MNDFQVFGLQVTLNLVAFSLIAAFYVWPRLRAIPLREALIALLFANTFRSLGATMLVTVVADPNLPRSFANPVVYGDLLAVGLAFLAILALRRNWSFALGLVWLFNLEGFLDLLNAYYQGIRISAYQYQLGATWLIPTLVVPALLVIHVMIFILLLRRRQPQGG